MVNHPHPIRQLRRISPNFSELQQADFHTMQTAFTRSSSLYKALDEKLKGVPKDQRKTDRYIALNTAFIAVKKSWTPAREAYNSVRLNTGRTVDEMASVIAQFNGIFEILEAIPGLKD